MSHRTSLSIAAFAAWAAVTYAIGLDSVLWPPVVGLSARTVSFILLLLFLTAYVFLNWIPALPRWRLRTPIAIATQAGSALGLMALFPPSTAPVLLIVVAAEIMFRYDLAIAWLMLMILNVAFFAVIFFDWNSSNPLFTLALYGGFQAFAALTASALKQSQAAAEALRMTNAELLATRSLLAETARDGERLRVSRELHDVAGHKLTALSLNLELLRLDEKLAVRREFQVIRELSAELLSDVRSVVSSLRHDDGLNLQEALQRLTEVFPQPRVSLSMDAGLRIESAAQAEAILRCAQEALTNAARHACADHVWLSLSQGHGYVELVVEDDGAFSGKYSPGSGLSGMRERIDQLGGMLDIGIGSRAGFRIAARLPQRSVA